MKASIKIFLSLICMTALVACGKSAEQTKEESRQVAREQVVEPAQEAMQKAKDTEKVMAESTARIDEAETEATASPENTERPKNTEKPQN